MQKYSVLIKRYLPKGEFYIEVEKGCGDVNSETEFSDVVFRSIVDSWKTAGILAGKLRTIYFGINQRLPRT